MDPAVHAIASQGASYHSQELHPSFEASQMAPAYNGGAEKAWKVEYGKSAEAGGEKKKSDEPSKTPK